MTSTEERLLRPIRRRRATSMTRTMTPALASGMPAVQHRRAKSSASTSLRWRRCDRTGTWKDTEGYDAGHSKLLDVMVDEAVLLPAVHPEVCAGLGCVATCLCWCHAWEWRP